MFFAFTNVYDVDYKVQLDHATFQGTIIKHILKSTHQNWASQLKTAIKNAVMYPYCPQARLRLLNFSNIILLAPPRGGIKHNLMTILKSRLINDDFTISNHMLSILIAIKLKNDIKLVSPSSRQKSKTGTLKQCWQCCSELAASHKAEKCVDMAITHNFIPLAFETLGAIFSKALVFLQELGRRLTLATED